MQKTIGNPAQESLVHGVSVDLAALVTRVEGLDKKVDALTLVRFSQNHCTLRSLIVVDYPSSRLATHKHSLYKAFRTSKLKSSQPCYPSFRYYNPFRFTLIWLATL